MKRLLLIIGAGFLIGSGALLLYARPWPEPEQMGPPPSTPDIAAPTVTPTTAMVGTPTTITATVYIPDPTLNPTTVQLLRVEADGNNSVVADMKDNGQGSDQKPGDKIFTGTFTINERAEDVFVLTVAANFRGQDRVVSGSQTPFAIISPSGPSLVDLGKGSQTILFATVSNQRSLNAAGQIVTDVSLTVSRVLKGSGITSAVVRVPGGKIGNVASYSPGVPLFTNGERVVLLLAGPDAAGDYHIPDLALGVFHVRDDQALGPVAIIDSGYTGLDGTQGFNPATSSVLQQSAAGQLSLDALYSQLGVVQ